MEFLPAEQVRRTLEEHGVAEHAEGDRVRLVLRHVGGRASGGRRVVHMGPDNNGASAGEEFVRVGADRLPEAVERILHKAQVNDFVLMPVEKWGPVLDLLAFDLTSEACWLEVDADASLHKNTRDPLGMTSKHRRLVRLIARSLFSRSPGPECDVVIAALDAPFLLELRHVPAVVLHCEQALGNSIVNQVIGA